MSFNSGPPTPENGEYSQQNLPEPGSTNNSAHQKKSNAQSFLQLAPNPITLKFEEIIYKIKCESKGASHGISRNTEKIILHGISGMVCPGEILAMLGPSGSGKTTLLTALGGRLSGRLSGKITYNDLPFSGSVKRRTGFVAQDDILYQHLTVFETLLFTALLRLPQILRKADKTHHVEHIIAELGLIKCRNSMVGGNLVRGISGGEKKRVSIGQEMLINPSLLLLDEPTSGLDSTTAMKLLKTLKDLANGGRTVITTIHQPSSRLFHMFDKVVLLSEGWPIYYGAAFNALEYFSSIGFFTSITINPADLLLDLANGIALDSTKTSMEQVESSEKEQQSVREILISSYNKNISTILKSQLNQMDRNNHIKDVSLKRDTKVDQWCTSWCYQFRVLLQRGLRERRYEAFNRLRIFQVISVAVLAGLLWWQTPTSHIGDRIAMLFFFSVFWGFYPMYNAVFTFPQEKKMLIKELNSGMYHLSSYFISKTLGDLPLELALPTAFTFILYFMGGLKPDPITFILSLLIVLFTVLVSQSIGLAFGAMLMDVKQATTLSSVTSLVFLMAGGYYIQQIPTFIVWLKYLSFGYYCYKLLLGVQYGGNDFYECSKGERCHVADFPGIRSVGLDNMGVDVCAMALMLVGYRVVAYLALQRMR